MPGASTKRNMVTALVPMLADTTANWATSTALIPANTQARDVTLGRVKIGDGTKKFSDLPWAIEASLPAEYRVLLDKLFTTTDGGVTYSVRTGLIPNAPVLAEADGKISHDKLPSFILNTVKVVANIAERDALDASFHKSIVLVVDATADTTVAAGAAMYTWYDPDGTGALPDSWNKLSEIGEMDVNWDIMLGDHFKYKGADANTLDDIHDGLTYGKMTKAEITRLSQVESLADVTDYDNVQLANAIMYDHPLQVVQMDAAGLAAFQALA